MTGHKNTANTGFSYRPWRKFWVGSPQIPSIVPDKVKELFPQANMLVKISPRASNALSRDCLQTMIRDFWKLPPRAKGTLHQEFSYIASKVSTETKESIDIVRSVGSIDAQFCEDVNMMVSTTEEETRLLISLIEVLFEDWYLERENREKRRVGLSQLAEQAQKTVPTLLTKKAIPKLTSVEISANGASKVSKVSKKSKTPKPVTGKSATK